MFPLNTCLGVEYEARTETNLIKNSKESGNPYSILSAWSSGLVRSNTPAPDTYIQ